MTDERRLADDGSDPDDDSRRQLWFRAGVAGGLIALLLGALAVFDHLSKPRGSEEVALPTKPIAPAQVASDAGRDAPPDVIRAGSEEAQAQTAEEQPAETTVPPMLPRDSAGAEAQGDRLEAPRASAARPHQAASSVHGREVERRAAARGDESPRSAAVPVPAAAPPVQAPRVPAAAAPGLAQQTSPAPQRDLPPTGAAVAPRPAGVAPVASASPAAAASAAAQPQSGAAPAPAASMPARPAPAAAQAATAPAEAQGRGYVLQFGFFSSVARAEELKARLAQAGIPAQVETRLVVGPFADRREALAAQARLREKGIDTGVLLPLGR